VLRIDSPGGSAFASDLIRRELDALQQRGIPVVVSMGSLAASGGYWIAAGADRIFAAPTTITGSIGVFGILPTFDESLASVGVHSDGMGTTALAGLNQLDRPMTPQAQRLIQLSVDNLYQQFIKLVAESRELPLGRVNDIAQGHVWTGAKAQEIGLVDEIGDIKDAIAAAAKLANLDGYETEYLERPRSLEEQLLKGLSHNIAQIRLLLEFAGPANSNAVNWLERLLALVSALPSPVTFSDPRGLYAQCFDCDPGH
jgi:protease-4